MLELFFYVSLLAIWEGLIKIIIKNKDKNKNKNNISNKESDNIFIIGMRVL